MKFFILLGLFFSLSAALFGAQRLQDNKTKFIIKDSLALNVIESEDQDWILLLQKMPWAWRIYQALPKKWTLARQDIVWSAGEVVIQNPWDYTAKPLVLGQKRSQIFFSFDENSGSFNSQLEIPLLYSDSAQINWKQVPPGYYALRLRPGSTWGGQRFNIKVETHF